MKKRIVLIIIIIILIGAGTVLGVILHNKSTNIIGEFKLSDYQYFLDNFSSDTRVEEIDNDEEAKAQAEKIWIEHFGREVKREKPYNVSYDSENNVWMVYGSLPRYYSAGGEAYILIQSDGRVLAIWHYK